VAHNLYIANAEIVPFDDGTYRGAFVFGEFRFDPRAVMVPHCIPRAQMGEPHQLVLHVAGVTYYPTARGYVHVESYQ
jgi:hypothetical protein